MPSLFLFTCCKPIVLENYLKVALRNARRHPGYAVVNVVGLALGVAVCVLILLYVRDELTFDRFHQGAERIYRVQGKKAYGDAEGFTIANPPISLAASLVQTSAEVEAAAVIRDPGRVIVLRNGEPSYEDGLRFASASFLQMFDFPLLRGDRATALARPGTVVLTQAAAETYFGKEDPIGRTLHMAPDVQLEVTGILAPLPTNTIFRFGLLASLETLTAAGKEPAASRGLSGTFTYVRITGAGALPTVDASLTTLFAAAPETKGYRPVLDPLTSLHLNDRTYAGDSSLAGHVQYVYLFSGIAVLVLLIACINFTNLATAQALRRAREVGVRKVVGARRRQLVAQHLGETLLLSLAAVLLAVALIEVALPWFNALVGKDLHVTYLGSGSILPWLAAAWLGVGLMAGAYPALVLSGFNTQRVLKGESASSPGGSTLRRVLVVSQFTISIGLVIAVLVIEQQLSYMQRRNMSMQPDQVVMVGAYDQAGSNYQTLQEELRRIPGVTGTALSNYPAAIGLPATPEGAASQTFVNTLLVTGDFLDMLNIQVRAGRNLLASQPADYDGPVLVNEAAARAFGWSNPVGKHIDRFGMDLADERTSEVVGVVEDFPTGSLRNEIRPLMIILTDDAAFLDGDQISVLARIDPSHVQTTLAAIGKTWKKFAPGRPFTYQFLDDRFASFYRAERQLGWLFGTFAGLAGLIAMMGLLGLAVYAATRRTKEIGIRKVLGAGVRDILVLLTREFVVLVVAAFVVAAPLAYLGMQRWLQDFAYRITIPWWIFAVAGGTAVVVTLLTVSTQALRAAVAAPVKSLRHE